MELGFVPIAREVLEISGAVVVRMDGPTWVLDACFGSRRSAFQTETYRIFVQLRMGAEPGPR